jgi:hypothetical protein
MGKAVRGRRLCPLYGNPARVSERRVLLSVLRRSPRGMPHPVETQPDGRALENAQGRKPRG